MQEQLGSRVINTILKEEKINANKLAERLQLSRAQPIYDLMNGKIKKVSANYANKIIEAFPHYSYTWLTTGEGEMLKPNVETNITPVNNESYLMVEYIDLRASAGRLGGADVEQLPETHKRLVPKEYETGDFLVIRVDGDSMDDGTKRSLSDGDEVLVCERKDFKIDELPIKKSLFVITSREGNVLKQILEVNMEEQYILCHSFNPRYPDFKIYFVDIYQIFIVCKVTQSQISLI